MGNRGRMCFLPWDVSKPYYPFAWSLSNVIEIGSWEGWVFELTVVQFDPIVWLRNMARLLLRTFTQDLGNVTQKISQVSNRPGFEIFRNVPKILVLLTTTICTYIFKYSTFFVSDRCGGAGDANSSHMRHFPPMRIVSCRSREWWFIAFS